MMKKILSLVIALLLMASLFVTAGADTYQGNDDLLLVDDADLLTAAEEADLRAELLRISRQYGAQVCVATTNDTENGNADVYVENLYDSNGYGYGANKDGVLLLVCMDVREYRILSNGFAASAITMGDIDTICDIIVSDLSDGEYADAFTAYVNECDYYLSGYINGFPFPFGMMLLIALGVGLLVALIVCLILKGQLRSVYRQPQADVYVKPGSMKLTKSGDYYMYRTVNRTKKQSSSSSSSSSGSSRNVGGGKF